MAKKRRHGLGKLTERQLAMANKAAFEAAGTCAAKVEDRTKRIACLRGVREIVSRFREMERLTEANVKIALEFAILNCGTAKDETSCTAGVGMMFDRFVELREKAGPGLEGKRRRCQ